MSLGTFFGFTARHALYVVVFVRHLLMSRVSVHSRWSDEISERQTNKRLVYPGHYNGSDSRDNTFSYLDG